MLENQELCHCRSGKKSVEKCIQITVLTSTNVVELDEKEQVTGAELERNNPVIKKHQTIKNTQKVSHVGHKKMVLDVQAVQHI